MVSLLIENNDTVKTFLYRSVCEMGRFVNPDNSAFQVALNSRIYVDKTGLIEYTEQCSGYYRCVYLQQPSKKIW